MNDVLVWVVVATALGFDFTNGFHDTANAVATTVSTRALSPRIAVLIAASMNLLGALVWTAVAKNVASGLIDADLATQHLRPPPSYVVRQLIASPDFRTLAAGGGPADLCVL